MWAIGANNLVKQALPGIQWAVNRIFWVSVWRPLPELWVLLVFFGFANTHIFSATIRKAQGTVSESRSVHLQPLGLCRESDMQWFENSQPYLLIIFIFHSVLFKSDQFPNPAHWTAAQTLPAADVRGRNIAVTRRYVSWICCLKEFCISKGNNLWTLMAAVTVQCLDA